MEAAGFITEAQRRAADAEPLPTAPSLAESIVGPYFCEEIRQYLERTYGEKDLYGRGLRVESTLDPEMQAWAEESLGWGLRQISRRHGFKRPRNLTAEGYRDPRVLRRSFVGGRARLRGPDAPRRRHGRGTPPERTSESERRRSPLPNAGAAWTGATSVAKLLKTGDLVTVTAVRRPRTAKLVLVARPGSARAGRRGRPRERERRGARDGRRIRLDAVQVQPGDPGAAPGGLGLQAVRVPDRPRAGLHGGGHRLRRPALDRDRSPPAALPARQLRRQVPRDRDVPAGARALVQRPDGPDRPDGRPVRT